MAKLSYRLFLVCLFVYSFVIIQTMYQMYNVAIDDTLDKTLFGIKLPYYMIPLFIMNIGIIITSITESSINRFGVVLLIWCIHLSINVLFLSKIIYIDIVRVNLWTTSYFASYFLIKKDPRRIKTLISLFVVVFFISVFFFVLSKYRQVSFAGLSLESSSNIVFCVLTVFPWILLQKNKKFTLVICMVTMVAILFSNKRSAMIMLALCVIPVIKYFFQSGIKTKHYITIFFMVLLFGIVFNYINSNYLNNRIGTRFSEMSEDGGSHRDRIWLYTLAGYQNSPTINKIIGNGHYKVSSLGQSTAAHNDFLEVLYDYGVIGIIIYLIIHIMVIKRLRYLRKNKSPFANSYMVMWIIFFVMSLVSILIVQQRYLIYMAVFWGAIDGYIISNSKNVSNDLIALR